jgi:hypothetical protein
MTIRVEYNNGSYEELKCRFNEVFVMRISVPDKVAEDKILPALIIEPKDKLRVIQRDSWRARHAEKDKL